MRNISFMLTTEQVRARTKTVTRRLGWTKLRPGDRLLGVVQCMGLKRGEKVEPLCVIEIVDVSREALRCLTYFMDYGNAECAREGFPDLSPAEFVEMFCRSHSGCTPDTIVTRIKFKYVDELGATP